MSGFKRGEDEQASFGGLAREGAREAGRRQWRKEGKNMERGGGGSFSFL